MDKETYKSEILSFKQRHYR